MMLLRCGGSGLRTLALRATLLALLALTLGASNAAAASPSSVVGVYAGARNLTGVAAFETLLGAKSNHVLDFIGGGSWAQIEDPNWWVDGWSSTSYQVTYSIPMLPPSGASLTSGARGDYNAHFVQLARNLIAHGAADATLRIGWEFNGNWFPWTAQSDPTAFAAYWRQIVDAMRSVPGQSFKFDWNPTAGIASVAPDRAYPGDAYVDYIGTDIYDMSWIANYQDPQARWADFVSRPYGLNWLASFAAQHGKQITIPEWGLAIRSDGHGGGDNPYFIERMHDWIGTHDVAYADYFEARTDMEHRLLSGSFPRSAARFSELFGPSATPPEPTPAPAPAPDPAPAPAPTSPDPVPPPPASAPPPPAETTTNIVSTPRKKRGGKSTVRGRVSVLAGAASSPLSTAPVTIRLQRLSAAGRWGRAVSVSDHPDGAGEFSASIPLRLASGRYKVQARYEGSSVIGSSISPARSFVVAG